MGEETNKKITLGQFIAEEVERLHKFSEFWEYNRLKNPEHFPKELRPGDWDEQLRCFDQSDGDYYE
jgi:hypothetical protein